MLRTLPQDIARALHGGHEELAGSERHTALLSQEGGRSDPCDARNCQQRGDSSHEGAAL